MKGGEALEQPLSMLKPDGSKYTRIEMEQQVRDVLKSAMAKRYKAMKNYGLPTREGLSMLPIFLLHWLLDAMIARGEAVGDIIGVQPTDDLDPKNAAEFAQRLSALVQTGQALPPKPGEEGVPLMSQQPPYAPPPPAPQNGQQPANYGPPPQSYAPTPPPPMPQQPTAGTSPQQYVPPPPMQTQYQQPPQQMPPPPPQQAPGGYGPPPSPQSYAPPATPANYGPPPGAPQGQQNYASPPPPPGPPVAPGQQPAPQQGAPQQDQPAGGRRGRGKPTGFPPPAPPQQSYQPTPVGATNYVPPPQKGNQEGVSLEVVISSLNALHQKIDGEIAARKLLEYAIIVSIRAATNRGGGLTAADYLRDMQVQVPS